MQEFLRLRRGLIADGRAGEERQQASLAHIIGQRQPAGEIGAQPADPHLRMIPGNLDHRLAEVLAGNIDSQKLGRAVQQVQQDIDLQAGPAAIFHHHPARPRERGDFRADLRHQRGFGAGDVVFLGLADGVKQVGARIVIKELRRDAFGRLGQALQHLGQEIHRLGLAVVEIGDAVGGQVILGGVWAHTLSGGVCGLN